MKRIDRLLFLLCMFLAVPLMAQTQAETKALYDNGAYEEALPGLLKLVKSQPANGNYNLWYGVASLETGAYADAVKYLELAVRYRATGGQYWLAQAYITSYRYEDAVRTAESYLSDLQKRKRPTEEAEALLEKCRAGLRMMKGVERVLVVDSVVVEKNQLLEAYQLSPETGRLFTYNAYFGKENVKEDEEGVQEDLRTVFLTERGNTIYYSQLQPDSTFGLYTRHKYLGEWSGETALPDNINEGVDAAYPFMSADGTTLYYAADGDASQGGYDIFVTRYDSNSGTSYSPENIGMPFNSPFNDYLYVVDEFNNLGWFASDRYQPKDTLCVYIFVPNASKQVYSYEDMDQAELTRYASLRSIADTWTDKAALEQAKARLQAVAEARRQGAAAQGFAFVIDDSHVYRSMNDFRSADARDSFKRYQQAVTNYQLQLQRLDALRQRYAGASQSEKSGLAPSILTLEARVEQLTAQMKQLALLVRQQEKDTFK
ncbi:MAG: hypothetical protein LUC23_01340 [Prevotellaceae bacterium]|nr:hypothetical protein [Prevotellaceae bacterium]